MKKVIAFILAILMCLGGSAFSELLPGSEAIQSPTVWSLIKMESDYFTLSDFPNDLIPVEIIRVNLYGDYRNKRFVQALFTPFCIPDQLNSVILTDGTYMAQAAFDIQGDALQLYFYVPDLIRFDSTTGLWLILIERVT